MKNRISLSFALEEFLDLMLFLPSCRVHMLYTRPALDKLQQEEANNNNTDSERQTKCGELKNVWKRAKDEEEKLKDELYLFFGSSASFLISRL